MCAISSLKSSRSLSHLLMSSCRCMIWLVTPSFKLLSYFYICDIYSRFDRLVTSRHTQGHSIYTAPAISINLRFILHLSRVVKEDVSILYLFSIAQRISTLHVRATVYMHAKTRRANISRSNCLSLKRPSTCR